MKKNKFSICIMLIITLGVLSINELAGQIDTTNRISVNTDFISGGGTVTVTQTDPITLRLKPHDEGEGGWSKVWWYFMADGLSLGKQIVIELDRGMPSSSGISPQIYFSYDQKVWGLTNTGEPAKIDGRDFFIYKHIARGRKIWFAYDLPYTPENINELLIPSVIKDTKAKVFELCKTRNNRPVYGIVINEKDKLPEKKYGIWLQARAHAFETGGSWVLNELTLWLLSDDPLAASLRKNAKIFIIPIIDVDGVVEGRTGKYQKPYDHWMRWNEEPEYWPETKAIKQHLREMAEKNMVDLFIDFHGPGGMSHPFFTVPFSNKLPYEKQGRNKEKFLEVLNSKPFDELAKLSQSMTEIHYSERQWDMNDFSSSHEWVLKSTNDHSVALTLEVNMNTPLSTHDGYKAEAIELGKAISNYFTNGYHQK